MKIGIDGIRARYSTEMTTDDYKMLRISDIAQMRLDVKRLLSEVDRLTKAYDAAVEDLVYISKNYGGYLPSNDADRLLKYRGQEAADNA